MYEHEKLILSLISQTYISSLSKEQLQNLCTHMLCGHGGVSLAKSMMDSSMGLDNLGAHPQMNQCRDVFATIVEK